MVEKKFTALIMAASRHKGVNPLADIQDVSHKCLVEVLGIPLLERVVTCLRHARHVGRIVVSIEDPAVVDAIPSLKAMRAAGELETVTSAENLFASVQAAAETLGPDAFPLIITTGDNALHTPEMIDHFCTGVAQEQAEVAVAMTPESVVVDAFPEQAAAYAWHRLRDGAYSNCNLYAITNPGALKAARVMETGGQFGKHKLRVLKAFGVFEFIVYRFGLVSLDRLMQMASRRFGLVVRAIRLPFAEAPIDVDHERAYRVVEIILHRKGEQADPQPAA